MRPFFFALLLFNALLLVWAQGYLGTSDAYREPERLQRQMDADKLRILPAGSPPTEPKLACKQLELLASEAEHLLKSVATIPGWKADLQPAKTITVHWVAIPELPSRALAEKKKIELRQLGVTEGEIIEDATPGAFAVSLGQFQEVAAAEEFLQGLARKGVRSARVVKRTTAEKFVLELRVPEADAGSKLAALLNGLPHTGVTDCPVP